jgi:putative transposase
VPQHLIQRGNNRQATFFAEEDYRCYLDWLADAAKKYDCRIHAYVLMTNHVHLLASSARPKGLSLMMQYVGRYFVRYINHVYQRSGTLWEGRFKASLVDTEAYFLRLCRYIECNPVRADMVEGPGEYRWSSYRNHAFGMPDKLLTAHEQYERLGSSAEERQRAYRELFRTELDTRELAEIRDAVNRGWPLGSERFKDEIEQALQCAVRPPRRGRPPSQTNPMPRAEQRRACYRIEKLH